MCGIELAEKKNRKFHRCFPSNIKINWRLMKASIVRAPGKGGTLGVLTNL